MKSRFLKCAGSLLPGKSSCPPKRETTTMMQRHSSLPSRTDDRRGAILVLAAVLMIVLLGFVALTVDNGFIQLTRTQLQSAADAAALSGAMELSGTLDPALVRTNANREIVQTAAMYRAGERSSVVIDPAKDITFGKYVWNSSLQKYVIQWGNDATPYNVVKVQAMRTTGAGGDNRLPLFFAPAIGSQYASVGAEAIATFQPRDIVVVLDYSGSMNDDSCFGAISKLGRSYIESNLQTMWTELGSPVYGNLTFTPQYATLKGRAASETIPHIETTFKRTSVDVVSTINLTTVTLKFSNGATQTFNVSGTKTGSYAGTGSNSGKDITNCWVKSGTNASLSSGNLGEQFDFTTANIKTALGLTMPYPYPSGSWEAYIQTVQSSSNNIKTAGYRDMYGYMTWLEYLQTQEYGYSDTPDLWKTSEQPVGSMKDAVELFINYLIDVEAQDNVGLVVFTHTNSIGAILQHGLSNNLTQIKTTANQRQAGHYVGGTNIYAGMKVAHDELTAHARPQASRLIVLLTDGQANLPTSTSVATQLVLQEAQAAKNDKIKILTIGLGADADTATLQSVADTTGGIYYGIPGGQSVDAVQAQLKDVFHQIASSRALKLISGN
jgi:Flp pilus assembly protein TadG